MSDGQRAPGLHISECTDNQTHIFLDRPATAGDLFDAIAAWWRRLEADVAAVNPGPASPVLLGVSFNEDEDGWGARIAWTV